MFAFEAQRKCEDEPQKRSMHFSCCIRCTAFYWGFPTHCERCTDIVKDEIHVVVPGLYLTSYVSAQSQENIEAYNIKTLINVSNVSPKTAPKELLEYIEVKDVEDREDVNIKKHFASTSFIIHEGLRRGGVLVHCWAGDSCAPTLVAAYLIRYCSMTATEALQLLHRQRPIICLNVGFEHQLEAYAQELGR